MHVKKHSLIIWTFDADMVQVVGFIPNEAIIKSIRTKLDDHTRTADLTHFNMNMSMHVYSFFFIEPY